MEQTSSFTHLHVHTEYSLLDGAIRIRDLIHKTREYGMDSVAITDHGSMHGALKFYQQARAQEIKPIIGCEFYVAPKSRLDKSGARSASEAASHLVLLAMDEKGYKNLLRLSSIAQLEGFYYRPRIDREVLARYNQGLIALTACLHGIVPIHILQGNIGLAVQEATFLQNIFHDRLYLEIQQNGLEKQSVVNQALAEISHKTGVPLVATNDCHYLNKEDAEAHDILLCIQTNRTIKDQNRFAIESSELYFKPPAVMAEQFAETPAALHVTREIAGRCNLEIPLGKNFFPAFPVPDGETPESLFEQQARSGLALRLDHMREHAGLTREEEKKYPQQLELELEVIKEKGFSGYFLIVADFINWAKEHEIPVGPGRGSAAGSVVAYAMGITDVDPLPYGLFFERFLNKERVSLPDIDVDFCQERRGEVIEYVQQAYGGADHVAQIITFGSMKAKAVIRDVGRAMAIPLGEVDAIAKLVPDELNMTIDKAMAKEPRLKVMMEQDPEKKKLIDIARSLEGIARHASTHAAGVVISPDPMYEHLPLFRGAGGETLTQFDMKDTEKTGLIKFDFLGLKTLTVIDRARKIIRLSAGKEIDLAAIPLDDPKTYELYSRGDTEGVFQMESSGMKGLAIKMKPDVFTDLIAMVALYRPGPLGSGQVDTFVDVKHGRKPADYPLPQLQPILQETYGVIVYQEQVMAIANLLAGYSLGDADNLRRAMGKKIKEAMAREKDIFLAGCEKNNIPKDKANFIFDQMETFAEYGFNKSHSAAYALVSYQTAWLKVHYPTEFMAALISCDMHDTDKVGRYLSECRDHDIDVLPPDINESFSDFTVVDDRIRFGLAAVKNVGGNALDTILNERQKEGPYTSLGNFCRRVDSRKVNRRVIESLIKTGAFDSLGHNRPQFLAVLDDAIRQGQCFQRKKDSAQMSLFGDLGDDTAEDYITQLDYPDIADCEEKERLVMEKEMLGFYLSGHPLDRFQHEIQAVSDTHIARLGDWPEKTPVRVAGVVSSLKKFTTKKSGELMAFATLEDQNGQVEMVVFPKPYAEFGSLLEQETPVLVVGEKETESEKTKILVTSLHTLEEAMDQQVESARLLLSAETVGHTETTRLRETLRNSPGPCPVTVTLHFHDRGEVDIKLPDTLSIRPARSLQEAIGSLFGKNALFLRRRRLEATQRGNGRRGAGSRTKN